MWFTMYGLDGVSVGDVGKSKLITKMGSEKIWGIKQGTFVLLDDSSRQFTTKTVESIFGLSYSIPLSAMRTDRTVLETPTFDLIIRTDLIDPDAEQKDPESALAEIALLKEMGGEGQAESSRARIESNTAELETNIAPDLVAEAIRNRAFKRIKLETVLQDIKQLRQLARCSTSSSVVARASTLWSTAAMRLPIGRRGRRRSKRRLPTPPNQWRSRWALARRRRSRCRKECGSGQGG